MMCAYMSMVLIKIGSLGKPAPLLSLVTQYGKGPFIQFKHTITITTYRYPLHTYEDTWKLHLEQESFGAQFHLLQILTKIQWE